MVSGFIPSSYDHGMNLALTSISTETEAEFTHDYITSHNRDIIKLGDVIWQYNYELV